MNTDQSLDEDEPVFGCGRGYFEEILPEQEPLTEEEIEQLQIESSL